MNLGLVSIDQGTTSTRALLINKSLQIVGIHQESHKQITDKPGWVSHDPMEIYQNTLKCIDGALQKHSVNKSQIAGIGILEYPLLV